MDLQAPINEAVGFLARNAPGRLDELRALHPELAQHLVEGGLLGTAEDEHLSSRRAFCSATLAELLKRCDTGIRVAEGRARIRRRLTLFGAVLAAVGSASVLGFLSKPTVAAISAGISLLGALVGFMTQHLSAMPDASMSLFDVYKQLSSISAEAWLLGKEVDAVAPDDERVRVLIGLANELFRRANELLAHLELPAQG